MFGTLFLGAVLAVFLTISVVRGDAERGLLQPLVVRPVGREALLAGRFLAAAGSASFYTAAVFAPPPGSSTGPAAGGRTRSACPRPSSPGRSS